MCPRKRKTSHGRYAMYAAGCDCLRCIQAMRRELKKRQGSKAPVPRPYRPRQSREDREILVNGLYWLRRKSRDRAAELRRQIWEAYRDDVHPKFLEGRRTMAAGGCP